MCSRFPRLAAVACAVLLGVGCHSARPGASSAPAARVLRVCADPNNLPFSNREQEGFENRLAELVARDLGAAVEYTWFAQRRGFVRNTLDAGLCDVVMGVPRGFDPVETTRPYYRSTYVFVSRADRRSRFLSLDDESLRGARIGVHVIGDDYANPPPLHALGRRGIVGNVIGYSIYGDYREPNPPARLIEAVSNGEIDVAIAWGPLGGYFGRRQAVPLTVSPVSPALDPPGLAFAFDIAMGVRKGSSGLRQELEGIIALRGGEIDRILAAYGVPRVR